MLRSTSGIYNPLKISCQLLWNVYEILRLGVTNVLKETYTKFKLRIPNS